MKYLQLLGLVGFLSGGWSGTGFGQAPIDSGSIVRLQLASGQRLVGRLVAPIPSGNHILYCSYPGHPCVDSLAKRPVSIPASSVTRIEVPNGNHLLEGALAGAAGAFLATLLLNQLGFEKGVSQQTGRAWIAGGFVIGALVGLTDPKWRRVR